MKRKKVLVNEKVLKEILIFLFKLNIFLVPLYVFSYIKVNFYPAQSVVATLVSNLLRVMNVNVVKKDLLIVVSSKSGAFAGFIDFDCIGWKSMLAFIALIFATPSSERKKLIGLLFLPLIFFINILRITIVFFIVATYGIEHFSLVHSVGWSFGMIFMVLVLWVVWMKFVRENKRKLIRKVRKRV